MFRKNDIFLKKFPKNFFCTQNKKNNNIIYKNICKYCKGTCTIICNNCRGIGRTYYGEKEFRCEKCNCSGVVLCNFCNGTGVCHLIF